MAGLGVMLLVRSRWRRLGRLRHAARVPTRVPPALDRPPLAVQRVLFAALLASCLTIPSNWTRDVPAHYGARHPGLQHWWLYPPLDTSPRPTR
jgi:hypothetical protein